MDTRTKLRHGNRNGPLDALPQLSPVVLDTAGLAGGRHGLDGGRGRQVVTQSDLGEGGRDQAEVNAGGQREEGGADVPGDVAELVGGLGDASLRVGGRDDQQDAALHHDGSVLSCTQSGLDRKDEVELDPHFLN